MTSASEGVWPDEVARYYDRNTARFLLVGRGRGSRAIHRELWGPGVDSPRAAADHINAVVAEEIERLAPDRPAVVLDFGCGVGGTLFHLAKRFPDARLSGVTVSARQVEIGTRLASKLGVAERCAFTLGDFQAVDLGVRADAIVAIESFAHAYRAHAFLGNAARHLRPGGELMIADDFLASDDDRLDARRRVLVDQFRSGWRVPAVCTMERLLASARDHGFVPVRTLDLTSLTRPGSRKRDRVIAAVTPLMARLGLGRIPFYGNMIGGNALQIGLREGFLRYGLVVLRNGA